MKDNDNPNIISIDVGASTGITTLINGNWETHTFEHTKSMTIKDILSIFTNLDIFDFMLLEHQNDTWGNVNVHTQKILQDKNAMWKNAFELIGKGKVIEIRKATITPLLKHFVGFTLNEGRNRAQLKEASVKAFKIVFGVNVSDDESDSYWFIKSFQINYRTTKEGGIWICKKK